jgi:hypothetical protein
MNSNHQTSFYDQSKNTIVPKAGDHLHVQYLTDMSGKKST